MISDPRITVVCNQCGTDEEFYLTPLTKGAWDDRDLSHKMKVRGWITHPDGKTFCSDECAVEYAADT